MPKVIECTVQACMFTSDILQHAHNDATCASEPMKLPINQQ